MKAIERKDRELFEEYKALRQGVARRKVQKDRTVRKVASLERRQRGLHENLRETRVEKKEVLDSLRERHSKLQAALRQFQQDERQIENQIAAFERMVRRRMAEARRRARMRRVARRVRVRTKSGRMVEKVVTRMERVPDSGPLRAFTGRFGMPVRGRITSGFGVRFHPILRVSRMHTGIDMGAGHGAPIYAAAAGEVVAASHMRGYGNVVIVSHGGGVTTVYAHASRLLVRSGQRVKRGQVIAAVGSTGLSTGPHLHFEVRVNGRPVNPLGRL